MPRWMPFRNVPLDAIKAGGPKAENVLFTACSEKPRGEGIDVIVYPPGIRYVGLNAGQLIEFVNAQLCEGKVVETLKQETLRMASPL